MKKLLISSVCAALLSGVSFSSFAAGELDACYKAHEAQQAACSAETKLDGCLKKASDDFIACMAKIKADGKEKSALKVAEDKIKAEWSKLREELRKCINPACLDRDGFIYARKCIDACEAKYDGKEMEILKKYGKPYSSGGSK